MIDSSTSLITRAVVNSPLDRLINAKLVVGVCVSSDNESELYKIIDGGSAYETDRNIIDGGSAESVQTIIIDGGSADDSCRQIIQVAYSGVHLVNICGPVDLGDKLCISHHPGKARAKQYLQDINHFDIRPIGKVVKLTRKRDQVSVLLDIE